MDIHRKILIAFLVTIALVAALILWMLVFNTGKVEIVFTPPFSVKIGNLYKQCAETPCVLSMKAYEYSARVEKAGFFPYEEKIRVKRWQVITLAPEMEFIPYIEESETKPKNIPENITTKTPLALAVSDTDMSIAKKYNQVIVSEGVPFVGVKKNTLYFLDGQTTTEFAAEGGIMAVDFHSPGNGAYITTGKDQQLLYKLHWPEKPVLITQFTSLTSPVIANGEDSILVVNGENIYQVNVSKKRKELLAKQKVTGISWNSAGTAALLEGEYQELPIIQLYTPDQNTLRTLPIQASLQRVVWLNDDEILFITFQEKNDDLQASFAEVGLDAKELAGEKKEVLTDRLMRLNWRTMEYLDLIDIPEHVHITHIELLSDKKILLALTRQGGIREIRLAQ